MPHPFERLCLVAIFLATSLSVPALALHQHRLPVHLPSVPPLDTYPLFVDSAPVDFTIRGGVAPWRATASELRSDIRLWRRLHLADWDTVPAAARVHGLDALMAHYRPLLIAPAAWDAMSAADWDAIPQPVRTVAYRQMIAYWAGFYHVGRDYQLDAAVVRDTMAAIAMQESWLDHRAMSRSRSGNRDLGLAQASDFARARMAAWHLEGRIDFRLSDADFYNPWQATRFLALWMKQLLQESSGDLDLAVRAYHRGSGDAKDARGTAYLALVQQRRARFIRNHDAPPSWRHVWHLGHAVEQEEWTWLTAHGRLHLEDDDR